MVVPGFESLTATHSPFCGVFYELGLVVRGRPVTFDHCSSAPPRHWGSIPRPSIHVHDSMATNNRSLRKQLAEHNTALDHYCRRVIGMELATLKIIKNGLISLLFLGFATFLVQEGADPTLTFGGTISLLALLNGIDLGELYAAWGEVRTQREHIESQNQDDQ